MIIIQYTRSVQNTYQLESAYGGNFIYDPPKLDHIFFSKTLNSILATRIEGTPDRTLKGHHPHNPPFITTRWINPL